VDSTTLLAWKSSQRKCKRMHVGSSCTETILLSWLEHAVSLPVALPVVCVCARACVSVMCRGQAVVLPVLFVLLPKLFHVTCVAFFCSITNDAVFLSLRFAIW
jgi:hypothetical protein